MKSTVIGILTIVLFTNSIRNRGCLRTDLEQYGGFYTSIEMERGTLTERNVPFDILSTKDQEIELISLQYLQNIHDGFLLLFNINYSNYRTLVVSTLDSDYCIQDFRTYPNFYTGGEVEQDTIAIPWFDDNYVTINLMNPNKENKPEFEIDGLWRERLLIQPDLKIKPTGKTTR